MKTERIRRQSGRLGCWFLVFMLLVALTGSASAEIIPSSRGITWQGNVGVSGDIPTRNTIYTTLSASGGNDTTSIQNAINNCPSGQVVKLNAGTFNVSSPIRVKSNITLRGSGMGVSTIKATSNMIYVIGFENNPDYAFSGSTARNITSGNTKGSISITTSVAHGWSVGDIILIDQLEDPSGNPKIDNSGTDGECNWCGRASGTRPIGQLAKLIAPTSGSTATLEIPLYWNYDATKTPQAIKLIGLTSNAGVEDITINATSVTIDPNYGTVMMWFADNCWLFRTEVYGMERTGIRMYGTYRCTVRSCNVHKSTNYTSSAGYAMYLNPMESANLIENNVFYDATVGITYNGATSGNVISYNYFYDMKNTDYPTAVRPGLPAHGAHPMMNLFEGNYVNGPEISSDLYWGTSSHMTFLRNRQITDTSKSSGTVGTVLWKGQTYYNYIGNVLGTIGWETIYETNDLWSGKAIYNLDYTNSGLPDGQTAATIIRHGNWDSVTQSTIWDVGIADHVIPNSYYLSSKPAFFGSCVWPPIGPDLSPMTTDIPAKRWYDGNSCGSPQPPTNLRIVSP